MRFRDYGGPTAFEVVTKPIGPICNMNRNASYPVNVSDRTVNAQKYGRLLSRIFDEWIRKDVGRVFVQTFESVLAASLGLRKASVSLPSNVETHSLLNRTAISFPVITLYTMVTNSAIRRPHRYGRWWTPCSNVSSDSISRICLRNIAGCVTFCTSVTGSVQRTGS